MDPAAASPLGDLLLLSGVFTTMTFTVFVVYGLLAHALRKAVIESAHLLPQQVIDHHNATLTNISSFGPRTTAVATADVQFGE